MRSTRSGSAAAAIAAGLGALALSLALGCGDTAREEKLREARERVQAAEQKLSAAESRLEERRAALEEAEERLESAKEDVAEARTELEEARKEVTTHASDALLFRSVQGRLLEDDELQSVAISAQVDDGVVTLQGEVPSEELRKRAVHVAEETAGVSDVQSRIRVSEESGEGG